MDFHHRSPDPGWGESPTVTGIESRAGMRLGIVSLWVIVALVLGFYFRWIYFCHGRPGWTGDEALDQIYLRHFDEFPRFADYHFSAQRASGLKFLLAVGFIKSFGWSSQAAWVYGTILGLLSVVPWLVWLGRVASPRAALVGLTIWALPGVYEAYALSTSISLFKSHLFFGGLMVLNCPGWFRNTGTAFAFGVLTAWSLGEDPLVVAFLLPVLLAEGWYLLKSPERPGLKVAAGWFSGTMIAVLFFTYMDHMLPMYWEGQVAFGMASWEAVLRNAKLLWVAFPIYWNGGRIAGYLQDSALGRVLAVPYGEVWGLPLRTWTSLLFLVPTIGVAAWFHRNSRRALLIWMVIAPLLLTLMAFLFSSQTWDALSFRYLSVVGLFSILGWAFLWDGLERGRKIRWAMAALGSYLLMQGALHHQRVSTMKEDHPAEVVAFALQTSGLKGAWANHWVSPLVSEILGSGCPCVSYDAEAWCPRDRETVRSLDRVGLVEITGLDRPSRIANARQELLKDGYRPGPEHRYISGWTLYEFVRGDGRFRPHPKSMIQNPA